MVKVEGVTDEEKTLRVKVGQLEEITNEVVGKDLPISDRVYSIGGSISVKGRSASLSFPIHVYVRDNFISVQSLDYFDEAMRLAEAYEKATSEEFTVKKEYE